jgi:beta-glucosidase
MWFSVAAVALAASASAQYTSPPSYPAPWAREGANGWQDAYAKAVQFVSGLSLLEKINLTTGVGWEGEACVGNTGSIPRLNFRGICMQDSPLGVRDSKFKSGDDVVKANITVQPMRTLPSRLE